MPFALTLALAALLGAPLWADAAVPESATGVGARDEHGPAVIATLVVESEDVQAGKPARIGLHFELEDGWHMYWRNPGAAGLPAKLDWQVDGATVGPVRWPFPSVYREGDGALITYGYADEVLLASDVTFAPGVSGEIEAAVDVEFLACKVECIPAGVKLHRTLRVSDVPSLGEPEASTLFERWAARVPRVPRAGDPEVQVVYSESALRPGDSFRAALAVHACGEGDAGCAALAPGESVAAESFVPDALEGVRFEVEGVRPHPTAEGGFLVALSGAVDSRAPATSDRLRGVLSVATPSGPTWLEVDAPLPRAPAGAEVSHFESEWLAPPAAGATASDVSLLAALGLGLLGGLVLNLMPCVLPVLALKLFALAELAHLPRRAALSSGGAYFGGVAVSMLALAGVVIALRAAGTAVGWGFQFQEPLFLAALAALLVVFAANLFGVFEIGFAGGTLAELPRQTSGVRRSFFDGFLAVVLATPCSAPFLGTAVGFAFASPPLAIAAVFLAIGTGLAAPVLLAALVPAWGRLVPRPGAWMELVRSALGFALLATAVWIVWLFARLEGADSQALLLALLVGVALAAWAFGRLTLAGRERSARVLALAALLVFALGLRALPAAPQAAPEHRSASELFDAQPFEPSALAQSLARGQPAFVYFTADWCLTCKVNERAVLGRAAIAEALRKRGFSAWKGDWTRRDAAIRAELARHGKAGVPLYLVYPAGEGATPIVLPELLTESLVLDALERAAQPKGGSSG